MRIVVIGGPGLIGSQLVTALRARGHEAVAASPESGVNTLTGAGLADVLRGTAVVVDVSDSPSCENAAVVQLFTTSTRNLLRYEVAAGVTHHVALSPVGTELLLDSDYFRARFAQEQLIKESPIPYSIVRTTPFFESLGRIADVATHGAAVRVPPVLVQPVAADDVARLVAAIAVATPLNVTIEVGGPEPFYLDGLVQRVLGARNDPREVIADEHARYFGARLGERSLMAGDEAELGEIRFDDWLRHTELDVAGATAVVPFERASLKANEFRISDVPPGSVLLIGNVAVFSTAGGFCATQATCTRRAGPLSEGTVDGTTVTCPLHGAQFNIWTGALLRGPATKPLTTYEVIVDRDTGRIEVGPATARAAQQPASNLALQTPASGETYMSTITVKDGTTIYYKDWGEGPVVTFSHGWPLNSDMWDGQMLSLAEHGFRVVAHDRRGHGRSSQAWSGNDMDGYADDLAAVIEALDLKDITMVGHSTGGGEVARYIGRYGTKRVAKAVLLAAVPPILLKSATNPEGLPIEVFDSLRSALAKDRSQAYKDFAPMFYGAKRPGAQVSQGTLDQFWLWSMQAGLKNAYDSIKAFSETDFTEDLKKFDIPTLVMHGEDDQIVPVKDSAKKSAKLIKGAVEIYYPGLPHGLTATHADIVNRDLLAFCQQGTRKVA